jgi:ribonucleoside-diphosphate reductase alpha chain
MTNTLIPNPYYQIYFAEPQYTYLQVYNKTLSYYHGDTLAASTFADKYALRKEAHPGDAKYVEATPDDTHKRIAAQFARIECNYIHGNSDVDKELYAEQIDEQSDIYQAWLKWFDKYYSFLKNFKYIVPQGSPMAGIGNRFVNLSLSNCVVIDSPRDSWTGISDTSKKMGHLYKRRAGVGTDISTLRPEKTPVNNAAGTSTGAWSFADYFSTTTRIIGQLGRRGALMLTMLCTHPDIVKFIIMKRDPHKVTGANVSVKILNSFMQAVENDEEYILRWPCDISEELLEKATSLAAWKKISIDLPKVPILDSNNNNNIVGWKNIRMDKISGEEAYIVLDGQKIYLSKFKASDLWFLICESAQLSAEPGIIMWDTYNEFLPACCYPDFVSTSTNPCSEISLSPDDSCRLTSNNLVGLVMSPFSKHAFYCRDTWIETIKLSLRALDNIIDLEIESLTRIMEEVDEPDEKELWGRLRHMAVSGRRTGLGTHGLADLLVKMGVAYGSQKSLEIVKDIYETLRNTAYEASIELAEERGAFPVFDWELEKDNAFIKQLPQELQKRMSKSGRRNISLLTNAPTGTVAIVSQTTSGIEPIFKFFFTRRRKINPSDVNTRVDFVDQNKDKWQEYAVLHYSVAEYLRLNPDLEEQWECIQRDQPPSAWDDALRQLLPDYFVCANDVNPADRVKLQGILQKYIDHGVSSTINLPKETNVETISEIYMQAWREGLKGVTVYVAGSRSGVLVEAGQNQKTGRESTEITYNDAPKRPKILPCDIHRASVDGKYWLIIIGLLGGKPYEVFGGEISTVDIPRRRDKGNVIKRKVTGEANAIYDLEIGEDDDDKIIIRNITQTFNNDELAWATRQLSSSLRHGVHPKFMVEQLRKANNSSLTHFSKALARVLAKYIKEEDGTHEETNTLGIFCKSGNCE